MKKLAPLLVLFLSAPALADETPEKVRQEFTGVIGSHLAPACFPIAGIKYRRSISKGWMVQVAFESGQTTAFATTSGLPYDINAQVTRLHGSIVTDGMLYSGFGLTSINIAMSGGGYSGNLGVQTAEAIGGLNIQTGSGSYGGEFRLGLTGPSTILGTAGFKF